MIAIDLRGVGGSDAPEGGYDKKTMAGDVLGLMDELGLEGANIVGHDIGAMVAFAFAQQHPERAHSIALIDAPSPGTEAFDQILADPRAWHVAFHAAPDVPERLISGWEAFYYDHFIRAMDAGANAVGETEIGHSVEGYSAPSATRAGLERHRAMPQDAVDNRAFMETPLEVPVLALNAGRLSPHPYPMESMRPLASTVEGGTLPSGHWIPETVPEALSAELLGFLQRH